MKKIFTAILIGLAPFASAQWNNTVNLFLDSIYMPVSIAPLTQKNPIVINSYPDGGYFVIWEDERNNATTKTDIYAQKYNAAGQRMWAENGVPVVNGPNTQRYTIASTQDYRNRPHAATDSAGGFYIAYIDDSITNYSWERIAVQHMLSNGNPVFPGAGYIIAQTPPGQNYTFSTPLLIADGNKGFFIAYKHTQGNEYLNVYSYKEENGIMKNYGGGIVNENAIQQTDIGQCGLRLSIVYPGTTVLDYHIWPDAENGCNVVMSLNGNHGLQYRMLGYNRMWRAKKNSSARTLYRNTSGIACPRYTQYKKDSVYTLYILVRDMIITKCGNGNNIYVETSNRLLSNGFMLIDQSYDHYFPRGVTITTSGNINVDVLATTRRTYNNNVVSAFTVQGYAYKSEKFDSIPYQRTSSNNPELGFNGVSPQLDKLNFWRDTLLASGNYFPDFSFAGGGSDVYASGLMSITGDRLVRLQHLAVARISPDSFSITYRTDNKHGVVIGKEVSNNLQGVGVSFDLPMVSASNGEALFYIRENQHSARVSPIINGAELSWGAMGRPIAMGVHNNGYFNTEQPFVSLHPSDGSGVICWRDNRNIPGNTSENIFMRHLDSLKLTDYQPPYKTVKLLPFSATPVNLAVLMGSSKKFSLIEYSAYNNIGTPVAEILDNYNFGSVDITVYQHYGAIRKYNNKAYLDRNFTFKTQNNPSNANISVRLFFTIAEFNALKAADASVITPSDLDVIRQPGYTTPSSYTPVSGEEIIVPVNWKAVPGGYYIEIITSGFSHFFIQKSGNVILCANGNGSITTNLSGAVYQWQMNSGSGFANISDNANFSGTNTNMLQLNNVPTTWSGYQFRNVTDGNNGNVYTLKFSNRFTGAINSAWEIPANWSCGVVPDANTDVIVPAGTLMVTSNVACRSLTVSPGASVTVGTGFSLTVTK